MDFSSFISNVISTVIGGILLALIFFFLREKMFAFAELDGSWVFDQTTESSEYNPYVGMTVRFLVLLGRDGNRIYGSAEKVNTYRVVPETELCMSVDYFDIYNR